MNPVCNLHDALIFALVGALAGLIRDLVKTGGLVLPRRESRPDGTVLLRLGFLASMAIGAATSCLVDGRWEVAAATAWAGPAIIEDVFNSRAAVVRRANGPQTGSP